MLTYLKAIKLNQMTYLMSDDEMDEWHNYYDLPPVRL